MAQESGKENRSRDRAKATGRGGTEVLRAVPSVLMAYFIRSIIYAAGRHIQPVPHEACEFLSALKK